MPKQQTNGTPSQNRDREILEEVFRPYMAAFAPISFAAGYRAINIGDLAGQAIIIPVEVEHAFDPLDGEPWTVVHIASDLTHNLFYEGHHGIPGKGYAMILPGPKGVA